MKQFWVIIFLTSILGASGCGHKKNNRPAQMSQKFTKDPFTDINKPSTLDLDELETLPRIVDLKDIMTSVKHQDERGTCSFFASIGLVESAIKKKMNIDVNLSEEFLNYDVKSKGHWANHEAGDVDVNLKVAINDKDGFLLERDWPYQPTWFAPGAHCAKYTAHDLNAPLECYSHNAPFAKVLAKKIPGENFNLLYLAAESTNEIITTLADYQEPLSVVVPVNDNGWADDGTISYDEDMRSECIANPDGCGFHAVVLTGYDLDKQVFFFKNSWGKEWGQEGYGTIPFEVIDRHVYPLFMMVELKTPITLPSDYDKDNFNFNGFNATAKRNIDKSLQVNSTADLNEIGYHTFKIGSVLVKKDSILEDPTDINTSFIQLSDSDATKYDFKFVGLSQSFFPEKELIDLSWKAEAPLVLKVDSNEMKVPPLIELFDSLSSSLLMRTTLYIYSDDSGYKTVKRIFHSILRP